MRRNTSRPAKKQSRHQVLAFNKLYKEEMLEEWKVEKLIEEFLFT
jgi:type IV secretory pathway VirD2 relaxase